LGASPGGWTRILRTYAVDVVAVDPGDLDRRLRADEGIRHERMTAGNYLRSSTATFDLVVNDLRMDAERSARLMVDAAGKLNPGGRAVVTLKVTPRTARQDLAGALRLLSSAYELLFARQLHHNRNEITLVLQNLRQ
jgi:23S rRNA (cytidine2498-2'-O)-methyltransferase